MIKKAFLFLLLGLTLGSCSSDTNSESEKESEEMEDNFTITGTVEGAAGQTLYLEAQTPNGTLSVASTTLDPGGNFSMTGNIRGFGLYQLRLGDISGNVLLLTLLPDDKLKLNATSTTFASAPQASGTEWSANLTDYMKEVTEFRDKQNALGLKKDKLSEEQLMAEYMTLKSKIDSFAIQRMRKNPENPFNLVLSTYAVPSTSFEDWNPSSLNVLRAVSEAFGKRFKESPISQTLAEQVYQIEIAYNQHLANNSGTRPAPEIALKNPDGKEIRLSSLRGNYVLIDFWASWCAPCRKESPNVVKLYKKYKDKGFTVYSVSLDNDRAAWVEAIKKDGLIWPNHVSDLLQWNSPMPQLYGFDGIPYTVLVNKEGNIIGTGLRGPALEQKLKEIFEN